MKKNIKKIVKNQFIKKILSSIEKTNIAEEEYKEFRQTFLSDFHDFVKIYSELKNDG